LRQYILPSQLIGLRSTPITHCILFWLNASNGARNERSKVKLAWETNGRAFDYSRPGTIQAYITFDGIERMIQENEDAVSREFEALLPSTYDLASLNRLPWSSLRDDCSQDESFIDSKDTWDQWLGKAVSDLKRAYLDRSETRHRIVGDRVRSLVAFNQVLQLDQQLQRSFVGVIEGSTGVAPRGSTMRDYRYRCDKTEKRNLFLTLSSVILEGGKQKSESRNFGEREFVIRALLPRSGAILVRYLALVRQALVQIMKDFRWYTDSIRAYETRILAKCVSRKDANGAWLESDVTKAWHSKSVPYLGQAISILDVRQYTTGIYRHHYIELLKEQSSKNSVDGQGDHMKKGECSNNYYGLSNSLCNGHSASDTYDYIMASRVYQATMRAFPVDPAWPKSVLQSPLLRFGQNRTFAQHVARHHIISAYGFSTLTPAAVQARVQTLSKEFPFLFAKEVYNLLSHA
jgi:hypothetical protein